MFRRSHFSSIVMMMVGGLLGSAGASGRLNPFPGVERRCRVRRSVRVATRRDRRCRECPSGLL